MQLKIINTSQGHVLPTYIYIYVKMSLFKKWAKKYSISPLEAKPDKSDKPKTI